MSERLDDVRMTVERAPGSPYDRLSLPLMEVAVERAIDNGCGSFSATVTPSYLKHVRPQTGVEITINGKLLLRGRIDAVSIQQSRSGTTVQVGGRDLSADLIDCSPKSELGEWRDISVDEIVRLVAEPYGVPFKVMGSTGAKIPVFKFQQSETCWDAIERACRIRGLLAYTDVDGSLLIAPPAAGGRMDSFLDVPLSEVIDAQVELNDADRFRFYIVRSQDSGDDSNWGESVALIEGNALDTGIERERRLVVLAEGAASADDAQVRAQWEATVRSARSQRMRVTCRGWGQRTVQAPNNISPSAMTIRDPWRVNALVRVQMLGIDDLLMISSVSFRQSRDGTTTNLELVRRDAFIPQPEIEPKDDPFGAVFEGDE